MIYNHAGRGFKAGFLGAGPVRSPGIFSLLSSASPGFPLAVSLLRCGRAVLSNARGLVGKPVFPLAEQSKKIVKAGGNENVSYVISFPCSPSGLRAAKSCSGGLCTSKAFYISWYSGCHLDTSAPPVSGCAAGRLVLLLSSWGLGSASAIKSPPVTTCISFCGAFTGIHNGHPPASNFLCVQGSGTAGYPSR